MYPTRRIVLHFGAAEVRLATTSYCEVHVYVYQKEKKKKDEKSKIMHLDVSHRVGYLSGCNYSASSGLVVLIILQLLHHVHACAERLLNTGEP